MGSPVIFAGTIAILEVVKTITIPHRNLSCINPRNQPDRLMTVHTDPEVLHHSYLRPLCRLHQPECHR
ncbi:hypothetical protein IEQ34_009440 [Dendrobium chrysotoxum]|uniref:Uncharacterized protein n=1 Tax=Dendrobium chrysotoxum TaxID=161865 RepID=A0AAV7GJ44_DENCH|nr:hypothetical protein IEQ34_009440 [Dendrobium chrysotoxum]